MCLVALFNRVVEDAPIIVGANREERYDRGGEPPQLLDGAVAAVGGRDPVAGGTWLGVNAQGVLVAATNRYKSEPPPNPRSRGLLVRELLACPSARDAAHQASRALDGGNYAGCNVLCADQADAVVIQAGDWLRVRPLPPGLHVLTNHDVNDAGDRRTGHALWWLSDRGYACADHCVAALKELCAQPGNGDPPMCLHDRDHGTVSSSILVLRQPLTRGTYLHAQGPPNRTPYVDYSSLLRELRSPD